MVSSLVIFTLPALSALFTTSTAEIIECPINQDCGPCLNLADGETCTLACRGFKHCHLGEKLQCVDDHPCEIICEGESSCQYSYIYGKRASSLHVECDSMRNETDPATARNNACQGVNVYAQNVAGKVHMDCNSEEQTISNYNGNCIDMNLTCGAGDCVVECGPSSHSSCSGMRIDASLSSDYLCTGDGCDKIAYVANVTSTQSDSNSTSQDSTVAVIVTVLVVGICILCLCALFMYKYYCSVRLSGHENEKPRNVRDEEVAAESPKIVYAMEQQRGVGFANHDQVDEKENSPEEGKEGIASDEQPGHIVIAPNLGNAAQPFTNEGPANDDDASRDSLEMNRAEFEEMFDRKKQEREQQTANADTVTGGQRDGDVTMPGGPQM